MATTAEVRAWAVINGWPELEGGRGRIPDDVREAYDQAQAYVDGIARGAESDFAGPDGAGQWMAADSPGGQPGASRGAEGPDFGEPPPGAEDQPSRPRGGRRRGRGSRRLFTGRRTTRRAPRAPRARQVFPRLSVAPLIEDMYDDLAWAAQPIPPLSRLLRAQAPLAGVILDPVVQDTLIDRTVLQLAARNWERLKVANGLIGTPVALMGVLVTAPQPIGKKEVVDEQGRQVIDPQTGQPALALVYADPSLEHKASMVMLRWSVRAMADAAGDAMQQITERAEVAAGRDKLVDEFIAYVLGMPAPPDSEEQTAAQADHDAGLRLAGAAAG